MSYCHSLKEKRSFVKKLIARVQQKFHVSTAEVGKHDLWQSTVIAFSVVGNDGAHIEGVLNNIIQFIEKNFVGHCEIVSINTELIAI